MASIGEIFRQGLAEVGGGIGRALQEKSIDQVAAEKRAMKLEDEQIARDKASSAIDNTIKFLSIQNPTMRNQAANAVSQPLQALGVNPNTIKSIGKLKPEDRQRFVNYLRRRGAKDPVALFNEVAESLQGLSELEIASRLDRVLQQEQQREAEEEAIGLLGGEEESLTGRAPSKLTKAGTPVASIVDAPTGVVEPEPTVGSVKAIEKKINKLRKQNEVDNKRISKLQKVQHQNPKKQQARINNILEKMTRRNSELTQLVDQLKNKQRFELSKNVPESKEEQLNSEKLGVALDIFSENMRKIRANPSGLTFIENLKTGEIESFDEQQLIFDLMADFPAIAREIQIIIDTGGLDDLGEFRTRVEEKDLL